MNSVSRYLVLANKDFALNIYIYNFIVLKTSFIVDYIRAFILFGTNYYYGVWSKKQLHNIFILRNNKKFLSE